MIQERRLARRLGAKDGDEMVIEAGLGYMDLSQVVIELIAWGTPLVLTKKNKDNSHSRFGGIIHT